MNKKQSTFVCEYLHTLNATKAAKAAVYSEKTACSQGQRLLKNVEIFKAIEVRMQNRTETADLNADEILLV